MSRMRMRASNRCLQKIPPPSEIGLEPAIGYELTYFPVCMSRR